MKLLITGLPGSGKTTMAAAIVDGIASSDVIWLDGDHIRKCWSYVGYDSYSRDINQRRICSIANALCNDSSIIISSVFPSISHRMYLRELGFIEILCMTSFIERPREYIKPVYEYYDIQPPDMIVVNDSNEITKCISGMISLYHNTCNIEYII